MEVAERAVSSLDLPPRFTKFLTQDWGIQQLHPPQAEAAPSILAGDNTLVAIRLQESHFLPTCGHGQANF